MSDIEVIKNELDEQQSAVKNIEQLETLAFHLTQLSKRLSQDREHWAETGKDLSKAVDDLNESLQKLSKLEATIKEQVSKVISQESRNAAQTIVEVIGEKTEQVLIKHTKEAADYLSAVVTTASKTLLDYKWQVEHLKKWFLFGIVISSLLGNILAGIGVYYVLGSMQDRNTLEIIKEIRAIKREDKTPVSIPRNRNHNK